MQSTKPCTRTDAWLRNVRVPISSTPRHVPLPPFAPLTHPRGSRLSTVPSYLLLLAPVLSCASPRPAVSHSVLRPTSYPRGKRTHSLPSVVPPPPLITNLVVASKRTGLKWVCTPSGSSNNNGGVKGCGTSSTCGGARDRSGGICPELWGKQRCRTRRQDGR